VKTYVHVTDSNWYQFLAQQPEIREVNFWRPSGGQDFRALSPGEPFLFKSHWPHNKLVGGGYFQGYARLLLSQAWDFFGIGNGVSNLQELTALVSRYRDVRIAPGDDPTIGCILLNEVTFFPEGQQVAAPADFAKNIVSGKTYEVGKAETDPAIDLALQQLIIQVDRQPGASDIPHVSGPVFGNPILVKPRLGQGGFKALVHGAYRDRCSVTGHKIRPTLQAAHILPVGKGGEHRIDNGLLLRSDVHTMFDRGYIGVDPSYKLHVSRRLRDEFGNGDEFYERAGSVIALPEREIDKPNTEFLTWHMDDVFLAS